MPRWFACPYVNTEVELTDEREQYILGKHDLVANADWAFLAGTLREPQEVRRSLTDKDARVFLRWYDELERGKYVAVVVIDHSESSGRLWVVTSYITDQPRRGEIEWRRA